ncbi:putative transcriptional regulator with C-terminal CBS domains [Firmicutes bacterium CAG:822]|nr:putative transcriptional regulator with C-terminal CBS domains [Firmicutes bacterium CAG:822]
MIGKVLKYMRKKRNFKQQQISEIVGVARNTISQYETETIQPTFEIIEKIANECGYKIYFESFDGTEKFESKDINRKDI